jgi:hypothetical protein
MYKYKCDACGSCVCYSEPKEDWGPANCCPYDVGFPENWRKVRKLRTTAKAQNGPDYNGDEGAAAHFGHLA